MANSKKYTADFKRELDSTYCNPNIIDDNITTWFKTVTNQLKYRTHELNTKVFSRNKVKKDMP